MVRTISMLCFSALLIGCGTRSAGIGDKTGVNDGVYVSHNHYGNLKVTDVKRNAIQFELLLATPGEECNSSVSGTASRRNGRYTFRKDTCEIAFAFAGDSAVVRDDRCFSTPECTYAGTYKFVIPPTQPLEHKAVGEF